MKMQNYVNMVSALIVLIGGLVIIFMYHGGMSVTTRVLIGLFVFIYFALRMGQTIMAIKRERRQNRSEIKGLAGLNDDGGERPKSS